MDTVDQFKIIFKKYKRKEPPPDFSDVIDFCNLEDMGSCNKVIKQSISDLTGQNDLSTLSDLICVQLGLKPISEWKIFSIHNHPGFLYISNPFSPLAQRYWIKRCLEDYPCNDNITNLGASKDIVKDKSLWQVHQENLRLSKDLKAKRSQLEQLRWITLGHHYDWTNKLYKEDYYTPFPNDLSVLSTVIAKAAGYSDFNAQAAIVNVYNMDSTLGGHNDHSELDHNAPLVSFSFGQSAIFLLGGTTKATMPDAIYLHSGDIIVMAGPTRLAYHGVPRILKRDVGLLYKSWGISSDLQEQNTTNEENCLHKPSQVGESNSKPVFLIKNYEECRSDKSLTLAKTVSSIGCQKNSNRTDISQEKLTTVPTKICTISSPENDCKRLKKPDNSQNVAETLNCDDSCGFEFCFKRDSRDLFTRCNMIGLDMTKGMNTLASSSVWKPYMEHMLNARINISVRQVTGQGNSFDSVS